MNLTCAVKHLCRNINLLNPTAHHCMNCGDAVHGPGFGCCYLWCESDKDIVTVDFEELTDRGKEFKTSVSAVICLICASSTSAHAYASVSSMENNCLHNPGDMNTAVLTSSPEDVQSIEEGEYLKKESRTTVLKTIHHTRDGTFSLK